jgi:hypothetical protein
MNDFWLYFSLGKDHIADLNGYDHILFIAALCLRYLPSDWKKIVLLVTAFTVGHSITLALSVLNIVKISTEWIEFLIPITILITAISNLFQRDFNFRERMPVIYFLAVFFGLVHGLGFSNYLKSLLGKGSNVVGELLAFNLGLEAGQLLIVAVILLISVICVRVFKFERREYLIFASGAIAGLSLMMAIERFPS